MKFVADESVDRPVVDRLRADGHEVLYVAEAEPGIPDELVLQWGKNEDSVLLPADKDTWPES